LTIANNDNTPEFADHTIFSPTKVDSNTASRMYLVENLGTGLLNITDISISGTHSGDFTVDSQGTGYPVPEISSIDDTILKKNSKNNPIVKPDICFDFFKKFF
jgi:hypothetical protein